MAVKKYKVYKRIAPKMKHYCEYWVGDMCEYYDSGYCWAHERPVDDIQEPCWADETDTELRDT